MRQAFVIGLVQCLALVPGTSRAGATIAGALILGFLGEADSASLILDCFEKAQDKLKVDLSAYFGAVRYAEARPAVEKFFGETEGFTRRLVAENALSVNDFIWPIFIQDGDNQRSAVSTMPGVDRLSRMRVRGNWPCGRVDSLSTSIEPGR